MSRFFGFSYFFLTYFFIFLPYFSSPPLTFFLSLLILCFSSANFFLTLNFFSFYPWCLIEYNIGGFCNKSSILIVVDETGEIIRIIFLRKYWSIHTKVNSITKVMFNKPNNPKQSSYPTI